MSPVPPRAAVLVADDEPLTRWALMRTLEPARLEVTVAGTRDEVRGLLASRHFEVVVLANQLGPDSMEDVLAGLASHKDAGPGLVILYDGDSADEFGRAFPGATLVQKPFCLEALSAAIESYVEPSSEAC